MVWHTTRYRVLHHVLERFTGTYRRLKEVREGNMNLSENNEVRLKRTLCDLDIAKGADAEVRDDGYLWVRHKTNKPWRRSVRIRGDEVQEAAYFVQKYMAR
jgi:hypothetical protein